MTQEKAVVCSGENKSHTPWVYFHGEAENLIGHDLVCVEKGSLNEGTQAVTIRDFNNNAHDGIAIMYYSKNHDAGIPKLKGLIVLTSDIDSLQYALKQYNNTPSML